MLWKRLKIILKLVIIYFLILITFTNSGKPSLIFTDQVRTFTRQIEFDYVTWTVNTIWQKAAQSALGSERYMTPEQQKMVVQRTLVLAEEQRQIKNQINQIYADPAAVNPLQSATDLLNRQRSNSEEVEHLGLFAESVLQQQLTEVLDSTNLTAIGQPIPPVQYHITQLPYALIVSPRNIIRQDADISLLPDLTLDEIVMLEKEVETNLNVSALVVPIGGVGVYPTMVMDTSNLPWLTEVVSHEWTHNFLTLHPLGLLYEKNSQLRIINETTASISGKELGNSILSQFYPQFLPETQTQQPNGENNNSPEIKTNEPPVFDYRAAMHETRVTADNLLAENKVSEAEKYMEERRLIFVANGYDIRRLNQAYFAFYGAYADTPGGAAGEDPVGAAVRALRDNSTNLSQFLRRIAWVTSYDNLKSLVASVQ